MFTITGENYESKIYADCRCKSNVRSNSSRSVPISSQRVRPGGCAQSCPRRISRLSAPTAMRTSSARRLLVAFAPLSQSAEHFNIKVGDK